MDETARWQAGQVRDLLARWDRERGGSSVTGRERVLADQIRVLLEVVGAMAAMPEAPTAEEMECLAAQLDQSDRELREATRRIEAGTRTLHALSARARSWEDLAGQCASPDLAQMLRQCAAELREDVRKAHELTARPRTGRTDQ